MNYPLSDNKHVMNVLTSNEHALYNYCMRVLQ